MSALFQAPLRFMSIPATVPGQRAEAVSKYLTKGSKVCLEGKLRYSSWEKDGQRRSKLEVIAEDIEFMTSHQQPAQQPVQQYAQPAAQPVYQAQPMPQAYQQPIPVQAAIPAVYDEEIPF